MYKSLLSKKVDILIKALFADECFRFVLFSFILLIFKSHMACDCPRGALEKHSGSKCHFLKHDVLFKIAHIFENKSLEIACSFHFNVSLCQNMLDNSEWMVVFHVFFCYFVLPSNGVLCQGDFMDMTCIDFVTMSA